jgi:TonB-linked SusC/RagA family outer membrane protein
MLLPVVYHPDGVSLFILYLNLTEMRKLLLLMCVWLGFITTTHAQVREVRGRVTDTTGNAIPFATVQVKGSKVTAVADGDGKFSIKASSGDILVFSSSGIGKKELKVSPSTAFMDVRVAPQTQNLSEVVVTTALGIRRQARELGYATTQIKTADLNQAAVVNPATGLAAKVSGVDIRLADNGVNPQVKVTFRGSRSIEGNNEALIVVDGIPVDQQYLANINPNDIEDITILKGSNAAALYGMAASNGVMAISTKKGRGKFKLTYQNTVSAESISYFPSLQNEYSGYGGESPGAYPNPSTGGTIYYINPLSGTPNTVPFENESFGVAYSSLDFQGDSIPIGVDQNGKWYFTPFRAVKNGRRDFFQTGVGDQNELAGSMSNKWGGLYFSGDHTTKQGIVPYDTYQRNGGRINGNANWGRLSVQIGASLYNVSTNIAGNSYYQYRPVYYLVMDQLPSTNLQSIKDINLFQNNQGFVNAYAPNPWWNIFNSRSKNSTDNLLSDVTLSYKLSDWLTLTGRTGYSRNWANAPSYIDSITFPSWLLGPAGGGLWGEGNLATFPGNQPGIQRENVKAHYDDENTDVFLTATKRYGDFKFNLVAGGNYRARTSWGDWYSNQVYYENVVGANFIPSSPAKTLHSDGSADEVLSYKRYDQSAYADLTVGYDNWLFLHGSFRNDWTSILAAGDRSFSYPSVDLSAVLSDRLAFLQNSQTISFLKVRLGYAGTGNVSLDGYSRLGVMGNVGAGTENNNTAGGYTYLLPNFGAYAIAPVAGVIPGFPFGNNNGYTQNGTIVQNGLKPEVTRSEEAGVQLGLLKNRINLEVNYYDQQSSNQTIPLQASSATGIGNYLTNAGKVNNYGAEVDLSLNPVFRTRDFRFDISGNFSYANSKVVNIAGGSAELDQINFGQIVLGGIYAIPGKSYPQIMVTDFQRDPQGRIIVNAGTGLPSLNPNPVDAGSGNYHYFLGLSPSVTYKGLTLKAVFDYRGGAKILNEQANVMDFTGIYSGDATNRQAFVVPNSVIQTSPGKYVPNNNVPITSTGGLPTAIFWWANYYNQAGMPYVTSADFWKLREAALTYAIPMRVFGKQQVLKALDLSLIGRNLFMWRPKTNNLTDPEFSTNATGNAVGYTTEFQTPPTRILSASIRATIF